MTPRGEERAVALRSTLADLDFDAVFSSPMQRALRTAELAGFEHPQITPLLQEVDYGQYEGVTSTAIRQTDPDWDLYRDGCPGGETPEQIYARAQAFIQLVSASGDGRVIAFSHGHILRAIGVAWIDAGIGLATRLDFDVGARSLLGTAAAGQVRVLRFWNVL